MSEDYWWLGGHIAPTGGKNGVSRYKSQAACCVCVLCMANHRAFNFKVSAYYCASLCSSQFFPFMSACHLLPSVCSTGIGTCLSLCWILLASSAGGHGSFLLQISSQLLSLLTSHLSTLFLSIWLGVRLMPTDSTRTSQSFPGLSQ